MDEKNLLDSLPGILFANDQAELLNEYVKERIDGSLFLFLHYTPNIIKPCSYDGKYLMGVSNLYKLIKDSGWVLEKSNIILDNNSVRELKRCIDTIHLLRTVQNHNIRADNKMKLLEAEKWWSDAGVKSQRPETEEDYKNVLTKLELLGSSLIKESEIFVNNVSKLNGSEKEVAITTWKEQIIDRYIKERTLFIYAINIYQKYSTKHDKKKWEEIILSFFINDYYQLISKEYNGSPLYYNSSYGKKYKRLVDGYTKEKIDNLNKEYGLDIKSIESLIEDINRNHNKYINIFFEKALIKLIKEVVEKTYALEIDTVCKYILEREMIVELKNDDGTSCSIENVQCFNLGA